MATYFKNDDEGYTSWLEQNPSGFLLNVGTGAPHVAMLHTTRCGHLWEPDPTKHHTTGEYTKAVGATRVELEDWAVEHGFTVTECRGCHPRSE